MATTYPSLNHSEFTVANGSSSTVVTMPVKVPFSVAIVAGDGAAVGNVEYTLESLDTLRNGTPVWFTWTPGATTAGANAFDEFTSPVMALKFSCTAGVNCKFQIMSESAVPDNTL